MRISTVGITFFNCAIVSHGSPPSTLSGSVAKNRRVSHDAISSNTDNFPVLVLSHFLQKGHMIYLNVAGLSPFNQAVQQEVAATLEEFSRLLYSEEGIQHYR